MKASTLAKRLISLVALLLAVMMMFTACGGGEETSSVASDVSEEQTSSEEDTDIDADDVSSEETGDTDTTSSEEDEDGDDETENTSSRNDTGKTSSGKSSSGKSSSRTSSGNGGSSATGKNEFSDKYLNDLTDAVKAKEVHVLMWRKYTKTEQSLVDSYQKKTGVKVRTTVTTESNYSTKLVSLISGGDSPDVLCFSAGNFPGLVTKSMQSLNEKKFRLDDDCWNKNYMDYYKINGKYFGVAMPKTWSCEDCCYVTYYNPQVLKQCGVSTMPYDLYKQGKWNWAAQKQIAQQVYTRGGGTYVGLSMQTTDLYMLSVGADFASYDGTQFTNLLGSVSATSNLTKAWKEVAELNKSKLTSGWDLNSVQQGKVGLFTAIAYGLYNEGAWFDNVVGGYQSLQAVPVAGYDSNSYTPVRPKVWGVAKKADNAEGAAFFLRYFLDVNNCNLSSTFYNSQFETVYNIITSTSAKKAVMVGFGVTDYVKASTYSSLCSKLASSDPANVTTVLNSNKGTVNTGIARANKDLKRIG